MIKAIKLPLTGSRAATYRRALAAGTFEQHLFTCTPPPVAVYDTYMSCICRATYARTYYSQKYTANAWAYVYACVLTSY